MKKLIEIVKIFPIILFILSFTQISLSQDQLYRNKEHNFRLKFPTGWEIKDGDGPNVIKKAVKEGSSIIIIVKNLITDEFIKITKEESPESKNLTNNEIKALLADELDFRNFTKEEILEYSEPMILELKHKYDDLKIVDQKLTYLDNEKVAYSKFTCSYSAHNVKANTTNIFFISIHKGKLYQINASSETGKFNNLEATFLKSINTFVFEDYE